MGRMVLPPRGIVYRPSRGSPGGSERKPVRFQCFQPVGCINPSCAVVASGGEWLVLAAEPSQPITPDDAPDRTRRPAEVPV
jgi:hypothetical protein